MTEYEAIAGALAKLNNAFGGAILYSCFAVAGGVSRFLTVVVLGTKDSVNVWRDILINAFVAMPSGVITGMVMVEYGVSEPVSYAGAYACGTMALNIVKWLDADGVKTIKEYVGKRTK